MDDTKTKWERLQGRFKNSWLGVTILSMIALAIFLAQMGDSAKKVIEWTRPAPVAGLKMLMTRIDPLEDYREQVKLAGAETIYPVGAIVQFELRHDGKGDGEIRIDTLEAAVKAYEPRSTCPLPQSGDGDRIFGAGEGQLREFKVLMSHGRVVAVQRTDQRNGPVMRGRSSNLLDLEPPLLLFVRKTQDEAETIRVKFVVDDAGLYRIGLSARYTSRDGLKTAEIPPFTICRPAD